MKTETETKTRNVLMMYLNLLLFRGIDGMKTEDFVRFLTTFGLKISFTQFRRVIREMESDGIVVSKNGMLYLGGHARKDFCEDVGKFLQRSPVTMSSVSGPEQVAGIV